MHLPDKQSDTLSQISSQLKAFSTQLINALEQPPAETITVPSSDDIFTYLQQQNLCDKDSLLYITEGKLHCKQESKSVYFAEAGDLIGLHRCLDLPCSAISNDHPVAIQILSYPQIQQSISSNPEQLSTWSQYLIYSASFFRLALSQEIRQHYQPSTGFLYFSEGDTIIEQGSNADCVYTLLEGSARAYRDKIDVGLIEPEQIFGALAVFTRQERTATVIAQEDCTVIAVRKEDFLDLIEHQPHVCLSLIEEMAERIHQLNQQFVVASTA